MSLSKNEKEHIRLRSQIALHIWTSNLEGLGKHVHQSDDVLKGVCLDLLRKSVHPHVIVFNQFEIERNADGSIKHVDADWDIKFVTHEWNNNPLGRM
jgi:hypothetical protein